MKKILVVVDMQNDFLNKDVLGNDECIAVIPKILNKIDSGNYLAMYATRDTHQENYMETQEGKNLPVKHCVEGTDGWQVEKNIQNALDKHNAIYVNKPTFGSYNLVEKVKEIIDENEGIEIELCGVCTGICVISNAMLLKAAYPEIKITVDSNCCACVTPESHQNALNAMKLCQINII